ncbi:hypothetical protein Cni_G22788 [Canna indica]|uniref:LOB domain-containing protein n=1 Tax=Canna indica TaxID=4628 RepID=A0AAQ3QLJ7_9LILI|nr:hypothetical protein Cni_G22788 [Canna indica]
MSSNSPCAACKLLRRKCTPGCVFAPYFPPDNPAKFACVHRVFGASNVAKILSDLSPPQREDAANSLAYEAEARLREPVYGCVGYISLLQARLKQVQADLFAAKKELAGFIGPAALGPFLPPPPHHHQQQHQHHHRDQNLHGPSSSSAPPHGTPRMGLGLAASSGTSQPTHMLIQQPQPLSSAEVQQIAMAGMGARDLTQEQELARFNACLSDGGRGYGPQGGITMVAMTALPHSGLALVPAQPFDGPFMAQPLHYSDQQYQQQQMPTRHQGTESDDGRSGSSVNRLDD